MTPGMYSTETLHKNTWMERFLIEQNQKQHINGKTSCDMSVICNTLQQQKKYKNTNLNQKPLSFGKKKD